MNITQTKTIKAALIEIIFSMPDMAKQWGFKCLLVLWLLCNGIDFSDDNTYEDVEGSTTTYEWQKAGV